MQYIIFSLCFLLALPVYALEEQTINSTETYSLDEIVDQISNFTKTPEGGIEWELFSQTKEEPYKITRDGQEWEGVKPEFSNALKKWDGETVKMSGYMFPLDQTNEQSQFLFGPFPLSCPYHYHAPHSLTIEVHADKPIDFSYEPITVEGTLELVYEDFEYNTFYRLKKAKLIK